jgi:lipopolysaccharide transport system ATP-binding protein
MTEPAISIRNLSKCYQLGTIGRHTLVDETKYWWHIFRGRDPREYFNKAGYSATEKRKVDAEWQGAQEFWALKNVSFDVQPGGVIGIIGRNGAGKSTLLKLLTRITEPTTGEAVINGRVASLLEVGTGFHPELTGRENIYMNGTILGMKKREIDVKFDEIVAFAEIEKFIDTPVKRYSSGMYVRLAFAVAAHLEPEILLVDEVLAVGDLAFQAKCLNKMHDLSTSVSRTILFVSHNMGAIRSLCDRAVWIHEGKLKIIGEANEVVKAYQESVTSVMPPMSGIFARDLKDVTPGRLTWVEAAEIRNTNGDHSTRFRYGDDLQLDLRLGGQQPRDGTALIWILTDANGVNLGWSNSAFMKNFSLQGGARTGSCVIYRLPLAVGRYYFSLSCGIAGGGEVRDIWRNAIPFEVVECDPFKTNYEQRAEPFGPVIFQQDWKSILHESN